jgi:hypothetical protein
MHIEHFQIADRFHGPPRSGNGGYTCGRVAKHLGGVISARLKMPPPLDTDLRLETDAHEARLLDGTTLVAQAKRSSLDLVPPPAPTFEEAERASRSYIGFRLHSFPSCFVCGPQRAPHEGLRIFPGPLPDSTTIAAPWIPDASLAEASGRVQSEFIWAALDCAGAFVHFPLPEGLAIVLGELTASIRSDFRPGERCTVMAWPLGGEGRKRFSGTAVHAPDRLVALARATWIEVPSETWG